MDENVDLNTIRVIAKVTVRLADGTTELWHLPTRWAPNGPYLHEWVYLPEGAQIVAHTLEVRPLASGQEIRVDQRELYTKPD